MWVQYALMILLLAGVARLQDTYCFRFTWLGPTWDNSSTLGNSTCDDLQVQPPCTGPLVITVDQTPPNLTYMWQTYEREQIACRLARGQVCLKYSNYYNDQLENVTYMCGKMTVDGSAVTSGCESSSNGAYRVEACACTTYSSSGMPCNVSVRLNAPHVAILVLLSATVALLHRSIGSSASGS